MIQPEVVLYLFVPLLIFVATQKICLYHLRKVLLPAAIAGSLGIVISMSIIAAVLHYIFAISWINALLFGVIISATDPLAVGAILHIEPSATL